MKPKLVGYLQFHEKRAPRGEFEKLALTDGDRKAGWTQQAVYVDEEEKPK